jgi:hypothetical protein
LETQRETKHEKVARKHKVNICLNKAPTAGLGI